MNRVILMATLAAFWPVWRWYGLRMTDGSDEPWGIVALLTGGWFLWLARHEVRTTPGGLSAAGVILLGYLAGYEMLPSLVRAALALLALALLTGTLGRHPAMWALFVLSLPVVASMQFFLGYPLRLITAGAAEGTLQLCGFDLARRGTTLLWNGQTIGVDAPCSGIKMLWAGLYLAMTLSAALRSGWVKTLLAGLLSILLVVLGNMLRATLLFFQESGAVPLPGWMHEGLGLAVFAAVILAAMALIRKLHPEPCAS